ncbi:hypothetical protein PPACK8108_LOCUS12544 [Phakopsora pachyrhizi]|uniref:Uncharacterized protein n=1 Tax=Phakopsora pachyrhizi TaxID=170000 RepID=A0AAV0B1V5_PHAPC|nr:hypothetical protein PPACK8108_LOCUS12544 [Phakopsora pachyrhizi]
MPMIDATGLAGRERVDIARPTTQGILQGQQCKGSGGVRRGWATIAVRTKARIRFGGTKIV